MSHVQPEGYFALPATGMGKPVLVLHPWWGLNNTIKVFCKRLAEAGFIAFAPDLYHGKVTDQISEAEVLVNDLSEQLPQTRVELAEAVAFLNERAGYPETGIAVIGFSMGAYYALDLSASDSTVRSVVLFYGSGPVDFSRSQASYLAHFAEVDDYEPPESIAALEGELRAAGRPVTVYRYPNTGHWFFEPDRVDVYNPVAAQLAWERTVAFLKHATPA